jgi:hypothetical protein
MIPTESQLRKRVNSLVGGYFLLNSHSFFEVAEEFVELQKKFIKDTLYERLFLWIDMVVSPIMAIAACYINDEMPTTFTGLAIYKSISLWYEWVRFLILAHEVRDWTQIVRSVGGPFISTNDGDYHVYVYADGMERLRRCLLSRFSKNGSKRL